MSEKRFIDVHSGKIETTQDLPTDLAKALSAVKPIIQKSYEDHPFFGFSLKVQIVINLLFDSYEEIPHLNDFAKKSNLTEQHRNMISDYKALLASADAIYKFDKLHGIAEKVRHDIKNKKRTNP